MNRLLTSDSAYCMKINSENISKTNASIIMNEELLEEVFISYT